MMNKIQEGILELAESTGYSQLLGALAVPFALIYPAYLVLSRIPLIGAVVGLLSGISALFLIIFYVGAIICYAHGQHAILTVSFALMALNHIVSLISYGVSLNRIIYILFYVVIAYVCYRATVGQDDAGAQT